MTEPAIRVEDVSKRYRLGTGFKGNLSQTMESAVRWPVRKLLGRSTETPGPLTEEFWALHGVSFEVPQGSVMGLIGPNGAGKSTMLKILARITAPTAGRVTMHGRVGSLLEVGTGFHPELTGRENVFLNGAILGMRRQEIANRYDEIVEFSGIEQFIETPVKRYSSGMYVRLAFAVAAYLDTEILLLDEVLAVGDADFQQRSLGKIDSAAASGRTIIFVSHGLDNVTRLCDTCAWIDHGRIQAIGPTREVVNEYLRSATAIPATGRVILPDDTPRVHQLDGARIRSVEILDRDGDPATELPLAQPFTVRYEVMVEEPIEAILELGVNTFAGNRVLSVHNIDGGRASHPMGRGRNEVQVEVDAELLPGDYTLDVGVLRHPTGPSYDTVQRVLNFSVENTPPGSPDRYPWDSVRGFVRSASTWSVTTPAVDPAPVSERSGA